MLVAIRALVGVLRRCSSGPRVTGGGIHPDRVGDQQGDRARTRNVGCRPLGLADRALHDDLLVAEPAGSDDGSRRRHIPVDASVVVGYPALDGAAGLAEGTRQQLTWRMARTWAGFRSPSMRQASRVGTASIRIPRRSASAYTSGAIGRLPSAPVPTMSRRPPHGMASAADSGVCPYSSRSALEGPLWRRRTRPTSMTTS